jgi:hypothetical protein
VRLSREAISGGTDATRRLRGRPDAIALDDDSLHELWPMQLLDELRRRQVAFEYEPQLGRLRSRGSNTCSATTSSPRRSAENAQRRAAALFLGDRHLEQYGRLFAGLG